MQAVKCRLHDEIIICEITEIALHSAISHSSSLDAHRNTGSGVYCVSSLPVESEDSGGVKKSKRAYKYHPPSTSRSLAQQAGGQPVQLFVSQHRSHAADDRAPARLLNSLKKLLEKCRSLSDPFLYIVQVEHGNFEWLLKQAGDLPADDDEGGDAISATDYRDWRAYAGLKATPRSHGNYRASWLIDDRLPPESYGFAGDRTRYHSPDMLRGWGSFYVVNAPQYAAQPAPTDACPYCAVIEGIVHDRPALQFEFASETFVIIESLKPAVRKQLTIFSAAPDNPNGKPGHNHGINTGRIGLIRRLNEEGLAGLGLRAFGEAPALELDGETLNAPQAAYLSACSTGSATEHFRLNCVRYDMIPHPWWHPVPWHAAFDARHGTSIARIADVPFYGLLFETAVNGRSAETIEVLLKELAKEAQACEIIGYPGLSLKNNGEEERKSIIALVPRRRKQPYGATERISGLEFLTGVLPSDADFLPGIDTVIRDAAFREATLDGEDALRLERKLRALFGLPAAGMAVYPEQSGAGFKPAIKENDTLRVCGHSIRHWKELPPEDKATDEAQYSNCWNFNILVRITRCGISQADRRFLRRSGKTGPQENIVLGHEGGGYIVDPGPNQTLKAGQKVLLIPHRICGKCKYCRTDSGNLCENMLHMGMQFNGCLAALLPVSVESVVPVDKRFQDDALPIVEPLACVLHALLRIGDRLGRLQLDPFAMDQSHEAVTVYGAGSMGCLIALALQRFWPKLAVCMIEPMAERRKYAQNVNIASRVNSRMPEGRGSRISIVTSNRLAAYRDAIASIAEGGTVLALAGLDLEELNSDDPDVRRDACDYHGIHRSEEIRRRDLTGQTSHTIVGSSGYNIFDIRRAVHELEHHYERLYSKVQNVIIDGLRAERGIMRMGSAECIPRNARSAVEAFLSPEGIHDEYNGTIIEKSLKVLIYI